MKNDKDLGSIYYIVNKTTDKVYIGMTLDFHRRKIQHVSRLRRDIHKNQHLQNSWNKYGEDAFHFDIIKSKIPKDDLSEMEKYYIEKLGSYKYGYNLTKGGGSNEGVSEPHKKENLSQETIDKIRKAVSGAKHPQVKISKEEAEEIFYKYHNTDDNQYDLAEEYPVDRSTIGRIVNAKHWATKKYSDQIDVGSREKLSKKEVLEIFTKYHNSPKLSQYDLADEYDVTKTHIGRIVNCEHGLTKKFKDDVKLHKYKNKKINQEDAINIFAEYYNTNKIQREIGEKYNVTKDTISKIVNCKHSLTSHLRIVYNLI